MGGLVIKQLYLLATRDPNYKDTAKRIHSVFFVGTPHRGADSAKLLSNVLAAAVGEKEYVNELIPNSGLLQTINDEFRHVHHNLRLHSFYETVKTNLGYTQSLVVPKDSAVMGLPGERARPLNADHRRICKFESPRDANYVAIRNALLTTIEEIEVKLSSNKREGHRAQMRSIAKFLSAPGRPEAHLARTSDRQIQGSCLWLTEKTAFQDWQSGFSQHGEIEAPKCFWLEGKPGTGKSVAAGYVIKYLESCNADNSYYFFRYDHKEESTVAACLRSLAYQMAEVDGTVRQEILYMAEEGEYFNKDDERSVWRALFTTRILRVGLRQPHYWVIDSLDECPNHISLFQLLSKLDKSISLRIFVTSRPLPAVERLLSQEKISVTNMPITQLDTLDDIRLYLNNRANYLPVKEGKACNELIGRILEKCNGSFLWVALVLKELEITISEQQINEVLDQVPSEMDDVYRRILVGLQSVPRNEDLAKAILRWTVCAARPLTISELKEALALDTGHIIPRLETVVGSICGWLVDVGENNTVNVVHETVRSYLTRPGLDSDYAIERRKAHSQVAEVCLSFLCGDDFQGPKGRRGSTGQMKKSSFADYAAVYFSEHISASSSAIDRPLTLLDGFFKTTVLSWIEHISRSGSMSHMLQTSRNLKAYLSRRAKYRSPLGQEVQNVQAWTDDLVHLVTAFGKNLTSFPESIHFLIPPVCPPNSMIHTNFQDPSRSLQVVGLSDTDWDDRISCMVHPDGQVLSLACREGRFALGSSSGKIALYKTTTFEELRTFGNSEAVRRLAFASNDDRLASGGHKEVTMWDTTTGTQLWSATLTDPVLNMSWGPEDATITLATRKNTIVTFTSHSGTRAEDAEFFDMDGDENPSYRRPPTHACFCPEMRLLGVAYRQRPISFWDLEDNSWLSHFHKGDPDVYPGPLLVGMTINPNPELELAAAAYQDGDLVVFNPFDGQQVAKVETFAHVLVSSPDGKTLATGDGNGTIQLFNYETLRLLYRVSLYDFDIKAIVFTSDNLRFFDIRNNHCNAWEPTVLVRKGDPDDNISEPQSEEVPHPALLIDSKPWTANLNITAMCEHHGGEVMLCGRENGAVAGFSIETGREIAQLIPPRMVAVSLLLWSSATDLLALVDASSRVTVRKVEHFPNSGWQVCPTILDLRANRTVRQILFDPMGCYLLISTDTDDEIWATDGIKIESSPREKREAWRWINHPNVSEQIILLEAERAHIFSWADFSELSKPEGIHLAGSGVSGSTLSCVVASRSGRNLCLRFPRRVGSNLSELEVYLASGMHTKADLVTPLAGYKALAGIIKMVIGVYKSNVLFLDTSGWVCSISIDTLVPETHYSRHFFIPFSWYNVGELFLAVTSAGSVALAHKHELAIFHNGLDFFEEKMALDPLVDTVPKDIVATGGVKISKRRRPGARAIRSDPGPQ
ncbi:hypothetical protein JX266_001804 [Neoarthrinium moseri]|nr:hypothetical protein JX266_001804 [Neoarthrinium moseri]